MDITKLKNELAPFIQTAAQAVNGIISTTNYLPFKFKNYHDQDFGFIYRDLLKGYIHQVETLYMSLTHQLQVLETALAVEVRERQQFEENQKSGLPPEEDSPHTQDT